MEELPTIGPERPLADANAFLGTNPTGRTDKFPLARRPRIIPYCSVSDPLRSPFCQGRPHLSAQRLIVGLKAKTPRKAELLRRWMLIRSDQFEPDCRLRLMTTRRTSRSALSMKVSGFHVRVYRESSSHQSEVESMSFAPAMGELLADAGTRPIRKSEIRNGFTGEAERCPTYPSCMPATSS